MPTEKSPLFSAESNNPMQDISDKMLHWDGISFLYTCIRPNHFPEHSDSKLKIAVPLKNASIQAGWQTATGRRKWQRVKEGHVAIIPTHQPREITWEQEAEIIAIYLEPAFIAHATHESYGGSVEIVEQWTATDPLIQQLSLALRKEFLSGCLGRLYIESVANVLAAHLMRSYAASGQSFRDLSGILPEHKLRIVIEYINENLEQDLALDELASLVGMSPYRFARAFKQSIGLPPHQYLLERRISRAKMLLTDTELSLIEISYRLGFSSQSHFTSTFRRWTAVTPKAYREAL